MALTEMKLRLNACSALTSLFDVCELYYMHSPIVSKHVKMLKDDFDKLDEMDVNEIKKMINHAHSLCKHVSKLEGDMNYKYWNVGLYAQLVLIGGRIASVRLNIDRFYFNAASEQRIDNVKKLAEKIKEEPQ